MVQKPFIEHRLSLIMFLIGLSGLAILLVALLLYALAFGPSLSNNQETWAQFGDYLGGVLGPFFAMLAIIALLLTLRLQSKELRIAFEELEKSAQALESQSASLTIQNFESRFFNMLSLHHQIVNSMDLRQGNKVTASGRDCLKIFYMRLKDKLGPAVRGDTLDYHEGVKHCYEKFYQKHAHELGHYFRFIYRILKFIHESQVPVKHDYSGLLRAQLSNPELALIFYNGVTHRGEKLKPLAEEYSLFENLELSELGSIDHDKDLYDRCAFGDQAPYLDM